MRITVIGCSGSFPGPASPASCYLVEAGGFRLLLDLGNGALGALQNHAPLDGIGAVCLSHLHGDHCLDMCSYCGSQDVPPGGPDAADAGVGPGRRAGAAGPGAGHEHQRRHRPRVRRSVTLAPGTRQIGPFEVTTAHMNHPVETFGFRVGADGRALAYSADTGESPALVELAAGRT